MFKKDNTTTKTDESVESVKDKTKNAKKSKKNNSKTGNELSQLAKDLGIRVSSPYGYYPEDVDPIISRLQKEVSDLTKENKQLADSLDDTTNKLKLVQSELSQLKMQMSLMEVPNLSAEEEFAMLGKIDSITGQYNSESVVDIKQNLNNSQPITTEKPKLKLKLKK